MLLIRRALSLWLALYLAFPGLAWAAEARDLKVEELVQNAREGSTLWVLTIGVSEYADGRINLQYADHDAVRIAQIMKTQEGLLFKEVFTEVLINQQATRDNILRTMSEFLGQASADDVVVIFLAGHGLQDRQTGTYYYVPHDASSDNLVYAGLPMPMFQEAVKRLRNNVDKVVLWLDTCHAGAASVASRAVNMGEDLAVALENASGQYVMSASKAGQESIEDGRFRFEGTERGHGAFTYSLLKGLRGDAADSTGVVWLSDLFGHVSKEVPRLSRGKQHPHYSIEGTDLPLFVLDESVLEKVTQPLELAELSTLEAPQLSVNAPAPAYATEGGGGSKTWLWLLLGAAALGGAGAVVAGGGGGDSDPQTGSIQIDLVVP